MQGETEEKNRVLDRIRRLRNAEIYEMRRLHDQSWAQFEGSIPPDGARAQPTARPAAPASLVDDFLPPELRVPSHNQLDGRMMPWPRPIVLDGQVAVCATCGTYRDWLVLSIRDQVWLRCRTGHQQVEPRLDTAWYNRHAGPADATHATFEDCLRHLGR